jgi:hypothetical protein
MLLALAMLHLCGEQHSDVVQSIARQIQVPQESVNLPPRPQRRTRRRLSWAALANAAVQPPATLFRSPLRLILHFQAQTGRACYASTDIVLGRAAQRTPMRLIWKAAFQIPPVLPLLWQHGASLASVASLLQIPCLQQRSFQSKVLRFKVYRGAHD